MTDRLAILLFVALALAFAADYLFGWGAAVFVGRKLLDLVDVLAVWR